MFIMDNHPILKAQREEEVSVVTHEKSMVHDYGVKHILHLAGPARYHIHSPDLGLDVLYRRSQNFTDRLGGESSFVLYLYPI